MARVKKFKYYDGDDAVYAVTETTTHRTTLANGTVIRSDLNGLYQSENAEGEISASWKGNKDFFWAIPSKDVLQVTECDWEEFVFERKYTMYKDVR
jgi:hypothetical protein